MGILTSAQIARREALLARGEVVTLSQSEAVELALLNQLYTIHAEREQANVKHAEFMKIGKDAADSLREMVAALECDYDRLEALRDTLSDLDYVPTDDEKQEFVDLRESAGECTSREEAEQHIQEDALSVEVRSEWQSCGEILEPAEFQILLSTGGPAVRIMGELRNGDPYRAWLEVQDWGMPWTEYREDGLKDVLLTYAGCFYFGES